MMTIATLVKDPQTVVVDVRTREEFMGGHVTGSINIPLNEVPQHLDELRKMTHIVLCCASGGRSGQATQYLKTNDIECMNGGSWLDVNNHKNN
jgi:phage shock protein E